jgi:hypothetical protein
MSTILYKEWKISTVNLMYSLGIAIFTVNTSTKQFWVCFSTKNNFHCNEELAVYQSIARNYFTLMFTVKKAIALT